MEAVFHGYSNLSGIYMIYNKYNDRFYIGSTKSFKRRQYQYQVQLMKNKCHNTFLQSDFNKCGSDAFVFEVLEVVEGERADITNREADYIDLYYDNQSRCYNLRKDSICNQGPHTKTPEETSTLKSEVMRKWWNEHPEAKTRMSRRHSGKTLSEECKQLKSESMKQHYSKHPEDRQRLTAHHIGNKYNLGRMRTAESKQRTSKAMKGRKRGPYKKKEVCVNP